MWKCLDSQYFINFNFIEELYYVGITDFIRLWILTTSKESFLADLKESNDGAEFDDETELLQRGIDMLTHPDSLQKVCIQQEDNGKFISVSMSKMYEITLRLELGLLEASVEHFFKFITAPLLKTVNDLRASQSELRELLIKKDKEIEEYKIEGKAPRRLITTLYDDAAHMMKHTTFEEYFSAPNVPELLKAVVCSTKTKRKRSPSPVNEKKFTEIKKCSQETTTDAPLKQEIEIQTTLQEVRARNQKKRLNY